MQQDFPGGLVVKNQPSNAGVARSIGGPGRPLEKEISTLSLFLPGKFHGQRSLMGNKQSMGSQKSRTQLNE